MAERTNLADGIDGHVFIVTYGRSGSTLLQFLLNSIDGYCIRGENNNALFTLAQAWRSIGESQNLKTMAQNGVDSDARHPWFGGEHINGRSYGHSLARIFTTEILNPPPGTRVAGFKEIRWANQPTSLPSLLDFTFHFFPNTRFVFNTRDHDEVSRSGWWAKQEPESVKTRLKRIDSAFHECVSRYPHRSILLHYNDYVPDHSKLKALFDFLNEPWDAESVTAIMKQRLNHLKDENI